MKTVNEAEAKLSKKVKADTKAITTETTELKKDKATLAKETA